MKWTQYREYKKTGISWVEMIPYSWKILPIKALFSRKKETNCQDEQLLSVYRDYGVIPTDSRDDNYNKPSLDLSGYQKVNVHDLVLNKMKTWQGSLGISDYSGIVSPAYIVCLPHHNENHKYLHFLLRTNIYATIYSSLSKGIRCAQWDLGYDVFKNVSVILPSINEQDAIVSFLERQATKIDQLITAKQRQIELLQEKRAATITQAVTKGLDPSVPMKDSGIEWLGEIPAHWEIFRLHDIAERRMYSFVDGPFGSDLKNEEYQDDGIPLIQLNNISNGEHLLVNLVFITDQKAQQLYKHNILPGHIVIAKMAEPVARAAIVSNQYNHYVIVADCIKLIIDKRIAYAPLIVYAMNSICFRYSAEIKSKGITRLRINLAEVKKLILALPSLKEQIIIADYLAKTKDDIDNTILKINQSILLLKEYRSALIAAAVTGQIDVREYAQEEKS